MIEEKRQGTITLVLGLDPGHQAHLSRHGPGEGQRPHATPKGLRHGFGVKAVADTCNPRLVQKWQGYRHLETTVIYMDAVGEEERELAARVWQ